MPTPMPLPLNETGPFTGAIDCDVHPTVPSLACLVPHLDPYWQEMVDVRGIESFESRAYPPLSPLSARPDWRAANGRAGESVAPFQDQLFTRWGERHAILNCLYGVQIIHDEAMAASFTRALNDWIAKDWLDVEPRLRASIVLPMQNPELAVDEIERLAHDRRFVQGLVLVMGDMPLGKRLYWPVYRALERHGLPLAIHTGSAYRQAVTAVGWPGTYVEDYVHQAQAFQAQLGSLISHGVFRHCPTLKVVLSESGVSWLPPFLWRFSKNWRGLRMEIPWVDRPPEAIVKDHVRLTLQPLDAPNDPATIERLIEHLGSDDLLLFSTDYPHWQFDGDDALPDSLSPDLKRKLMVENPLSTYPRLATYPRQGDQA